MSIVLEKSCEKSCEILWEIVIEKSWFSASRFQNRRMVVGVGLKLSCGLVGRFEFNIYIWFCLWPTSLAGCGVKGNTSFINTAFKIWLVPIFWWILSPFTSVERRKEATEKLPKDMITGWGSPRTKGALMTTSSVPLLGRSKTRVIQDEIMNFAIFNTAAQNLHSPPLFTLLLVPSLLLDFSLNNTLATLDRHIYGRAQSIWLFHDQCQQLIVPSGATLLAFLNGVLEENIMLSPVFQWCSTRCDFTCKKKAFLTMGFSHISSNCCV